MVLLVWTEAEERNMGKQELREKQAKERKTLLAACEAGTHRLLWIFWPALAWV